MNMKKIFYFFALLLCFAACDNEEDNTESGDLDPTTELSGIIANIGDYDAHTATQLLIGKKWTEVFFSEYDESWGNLLFYDTVPYTKLIGGSPDSYVFHENGIAETFMTALGEPLPEEFNRCPWSFDPETRTLTIGNRDYHLIALGEDTFIWDYIDTWSSDQPRYFREVFKAKTIE